MSELLEKQLNTVFALRKLTFFELEQLHDTKTIRPQMHLLVVKPFGGIKSSYTDEFEYCIKDDIVRRDDITKPALLGTVAKDGAYTAGLPAEVGGKVLVLDEFNNLNEDGLKALLGILENQRIDRQLGHAVKEPQHISPNEWTDLTVTEGHIEGAVNFSCIAFSMYYPKPKSSSFFEENPQALLGLKSRFCPNFSEPEHDDLMEALAGEKPFELKDVGNTAIRRVLVKKEAYAEYIAEYAGLTRKFCIGDEPLLDSKQTGFLTRVSADILRFAAHDCISKAVEERNIPLTIEKGSIPFKLEINNSEFLIQNARNWTEPLLKQYLYEEKAGDYKAYLELLKQHPDETTVFYAQKLNVDRKSIQRWNKKRESEVLKVEQSYH